MGEKCDEKIALQVSTNSIIVNAILAIGKMIAGLLGNSGAMISDAVHSASDVFSTIVVIIGVKISNKESDKEHQYGHERLECVAAIILALVLAGTGAYVGYVGVMKIVSGSQGSDLVIPTMLPLVAAIVSILVKEAMYWYTIIAAKKINSNVLKADAWHHRSDALSSVGSFIGVLGAKLGYPILDPLASIIICVFIFKVSVDILRDALGRMTDKACDDETVEAFSNIIKSEKGVLALDDIKTRVFGNKIYVDIEISADGDMTLTQAHAIAEAIHDRIEGEYPKVKHCMVHVNPYGHNHQND